MEYSNFYKIKNKNFFYKALSSTILVMLFLLIFESMGVGLKIKEIFEAIKCLR